MASEGDLLVRLYDLPPAPQPPLGVMIRRSMPPEHRIVLDWIEENFSKGWAAEAQVAMSAHPVTCWIATENNAIIGFACADATARGFFGPTGVSATARGRGIGEALLFATLHGMRELGYGYAVIGSPGPIGFYKRRLDAWLIPNSDPGIYRGLLRDLTDTRKDEH
jgi:hypothetical protein